MNKKLRELYEKRQKNCERIGEIAALCEKENRERNEAETAEYTQIIRENQLLEMKIYSASSAELKERENSDCVAEANKIIRENLEKGQRTEFLLTRDIMNVATATAGGIVPIKLGDIVKPLSEGLILNKVGLPLMTGLSGDYVWPVYEAVEAQVAGEGVALTDKTITMSKLTASPERVGISVPVSRQAIVQSDSVIESIIKEEIPMSIARLINKIMFSTAKVANATNLKGPFVDKKAGAKAFSSDEPTFKDFNSMKAEVLKTGITGENMCYIMTQSQKAIAEGTPKDAGSGFMVCENNMIAGLPVFCTSAIGEGYIGIGDWRYQPMGLFGAISFIIDPYSSSKSDVVNFVFNAMYGTTTLRPEAFVLKKTKSAV